MLNWYRELEMAKTTAESISKEEPSTSTTECKIGPSTITTNCWTKTHKGEAAVTRVDTRRVLGSGNITQVEAKKGVANEALPRGFHVVPVDVQVPVHTRVASASPVPMTETEEVDRREEALEAFWSLLLEAGN